MKILASLFIIGILTQSIADASVTSKKLQTINEKSFEVEHSIFAKNKPVVLFLAGLGNKGGQINQIRDEFNNAKLNLFTFSRHENPCDSFRTCFVRRGCVPPEPLHVLSACVCVRALALCSRFVGRSQ